MSTSSDFRKELFIWEVLEDGLGPFYHLCALFRLGVKSLHPGDFLWAGLTVGPL